MFMILVDQFWYDPEDKKEIDIDYVCSFIWGTKFDDGEPLVFDHPQEALRFISENRKDFEVDGNLYNVRIITDTDELDWEE